MRLRPPPAPTTQTVAPDTHDGLQKAVCLPPPVGTTATSHDAGIENSGGDNALREHRLSVDCLEHPLAPKAEDVIAHGARLVTAAE